MNSGREKHPVRPTPAPWHLPPLAWRLRALNSALRPDVVGREGFDR